MFFESVRDRWANLPIVGRLLISLATFSVLGLAVVKPGYQVFKSWKISRNEVAAKHAVAIGRMAEARDLALTILQSGNTDIEIYRVMEKATKALGDPRHGNFSKALLVHPKATDEDRLAGFAGIVDEMPLGIVSQAWASLPEKCRLQSSFAALFAGRAIRENHLQEATVVLLGVPEKQRSPQLNRRLIEVLIASHKPEGTDEAQQRINAAFAAGDVDHAEWLDLLEKIPPNELQAFRLPDVRKSLESKEFSEDPRSQLMLAAMDWSADASNRDGVVETAIERWGQTQPLLLARFLESLGKYERIADLFASSAMVSDVKLQRIVLRALIDQKKWAEMRFLLDLYGQNLPKFEETAYRTVESAGSDDATSKAKFWNEAIAEARGASEADALLRIERIVRLAGLQVEADQALLEAIRLKRGPLPIFMDLKPLIHSLESQERENVLMEVYAFYIPFEPGNAELMTRYAYLAVLNRLVAPDTLIPRLEALAKAYPKESLVPWTLATVFLCDNQPKKAQEAFDRFGVSNPDDHVPGFRIAYLTTQVLNGHLKSTDPSIEQFPWTSLKASERKRFTELIQSAPR